MYQNRNSYVFGHIFYDKMHCLLRILISLSKDLPRCKILNIKDKFQITMVGEITLPQYLLY